MIAFAVKGVDGGDTWGDCWMDISNGTPPPTETWTAPAGVQTAKEALEDFAAWLGDAARSWGPSAVTVTYSDDGVHGTATVETDLSTGFTIEDDSASGLLNPQGDGTAATFTLYGSVGAEVHPTTYRVGAQEMANGRVAGWSLGEGWRNPSGWPTGLAPAAKASMVLDDAQLAALNVGLQAGATAEGRRADVLLPDGNWVPVAVGSVTIDEMAPLARATLTVAPWEG